MPCPTSFTITGIFGLSHGKRLEFGKPNTASYLSAIDFIDPELGLNVSLRKYTPADEDLYEERALVFISAKAVLPIGKDGMLDIIYCAPVLFLREILPLGSTHIASVAGVVGAAGPGAPDRSFTLSGMNHVFGGAHQFIVGFVSMATYAWPRSHKPVRSPAASLTAARPDGRTRRRRRLGSRPLSPGSSRRWKKACALYR